MAILRISNDGGQTWTPFTVGRQGPAGPQGPAGAPGPPGGSVRINGSVPTSSQLPLDAELGDGYITEDEGHLWVKISDPNTWQDVGLIRGPQGLPGEITQALGDVRYVKASAGTWTNGKAVTPLTVKAPSGNHGALITVVSTAQPVTIAAVDPAGAANANTVRFNASSEQWEVGKTYVNGPLSADSLSLSGKATSVATVIGDDPTTLTTKGYVDDALPTGAIIAYGGQTNPPGWALCDGSPHGSPALLSLLGSANSPDLRGRFVLAAGDGTGNDSQGYDMVNRVRNATGGAQKVKLAATEMPIHTHGGTTNNGGVAHTHQVVGDSNVSGAHAHSIESYSAYRASGGAETVTVATAGGTLRGATNQHQGHQHWVNLTSQGASAVNHQHTFTTASAGNDQPHENMPPFYVLTYIIKK